MYSTFLKIVTFLRQITRLLSRAIGSSHYDTERETNRKPYVWTLAMVTHTPFKWPPLFPQVLVF